MAIQFINGIDFESLHSNQQGVLFYYKAEIGRREKNQDNSKIHENFAMVSSTPCFPPLFLIFTFLSFFLLFLFLFCVSFFIQATALISKYEKTWFSWGKFLHSEMEELSSKNKIEKAKYAMKSYLTSLQRPNVPLKQVHNVFVRILTLLNEDFVCFLIFFETKHNRKPKLIVDFLLE